MKGVISRAAFCVFALLAGCVRGGGAGGGSSPAGEDPGLNATAAGASFAGESGLETATMAGGCFWCIDAPFEDLDGVRKVVSGYSGGFIRNPTYEQVSTGSTGHLETVQVTFDPKVVSYAEILDVYWREFDPTDAGGSFYDRGSQYLSAIFYHSADQRTVAEASRQFLGRSGVYGKPIVTKIIRFESFYPAEEYHQHYCKTHAGRYESYRTGSGRDDYIENTWGRNSWAEYRKPSERELMQKLTPQQYQVVERGGTEKAFDNAYDRNTRAGLYVDVLSGEPLFSSTDKFDAGTGWPSFGKPIDPRFLVKKLLAATDSAVAEVRGRASDAHLGLLFAGGPSPTRLRYSMNSAALDFIPVEEMASRGYAAYLWLFR